MQKSTSQIKEVTRASMLGENEVNSMPEKNEADSTELMIESKVAVMNKMSVQKFQRNLN